MLIAGFNTANALVITDSEKEGEVKKGTWKNENSTGRETMPFIMEATN